MRIFTPLLALLLVAALGCSSGGRNPSQPPSGDSIINQLNPDFTLKIGVEDTFPDGSPASGTGFIGLYSLNLNPDAVTAEMVPFRNPALTDVLEVVDITNFLTMAPCTNCAKLKSVSLNPDGKLVARIGVKHPFGAGDPLQPITGRNRADLHVFNVEGIIVSDKTTVSFPILGELIADFKLLNADGYTGYLDATLGDVFPTDASIHPYITFFDDYSSGNFNSYNPMGFQSVTDPPPTGNLVMAMGCDYNYQDYVFDINSSMNFVFAIGCTYAISSANLTQRFTPEYRIPQHNKKSASEIGVEIISNHLAPNIASSTAEIQISVVDVSHNVPVGTELNRMLSDSSVGNITIEIPGIMTTPLNLNGSTPVSGTGHSPSDPLLYTGTITNTASAPEGTYIGLVKVTDTYSPGQNSSPLLSGMDGIKRVGPTQVPLEGLFGIGEFVTFQVFSIDVSESGWARTWGGNTWDEGFNVATDSSGNVYVSGYYRGTAAVDFNPGTGEDWHTPYGVDDAFLSKFDSQGNFLWARTWGGTGFDYGYDVNVDSPGIVYVTGCFQETVDFNPGPGVDSHSAYYDFDAFVSKFDSAGNFIWAKTWGGYSWTTSESIDLDTSGNIYLVGHFVDSTDFDPGTGTDWHTSNGNIDAFMSKFDSSGTFIWARTWGGSGNEYCHDSIVDGSNNIYMTGCFQSNVDFNPSDTEVDWHASDSDSVDAYLSKFDSSGNFIRAKTWGGPGTDFGYGLAVDSSNNVYVTGYFEQTADLNPDIGTDWHIANGYSDACLSKFDSSGNFLWAKTWGGIEFDFGYGVVADSTGNVYVTGGFSGSSPADFDPGTGEDWHTSNGSYDIFLSKFNSAGTFTWAKTPGGSSMDLGAAVTVDGSGKIYMTGYYYSTVDFNPGSGVDNHTSNGNSDIFLLKLLPDGGW